MRHKPTAEQLVEAAHEFSAELARGAQERDARRIIPLAEGKRLRALGLQAARVPARFGGPEASSRQLAEIMLQLGKGDPNVAQMIQPHFALMDWLWVEGNDAQRARYFGDVLAGQIISNAIAERGTKTPSDFRTALTRDGKGYRLNGTKFYSTGSLIADQLYILAVEEGRLVVVLVPTGREGVTIIDDWEGMGQRTTGSGTTRLEQVPVAEEEIVRLKDWGKRRTFFGASAQLGHAAIDAGIAQAALADAIAYAREKARPVAESGVERAVDDLYIMHAIGEMSVLCNAAEAMVYRSAEVLDRAIAGFLAPGGEAGSEGLLVEASIAVAEGKAMSNHASLRVSEMLFNVSGASATLSKYGLDRHWRNARAHTTHDPVAYKYKVIGEFLLSGTKPPLSTKF